VELITNDVIALQWLDGCGCHLRIWKAERRTIILLGQLYDSYVPENLLETAAEEIAWRYSFDGGPFEFFVYDRFVNPLPFARFSFDIDEERRAGYAFAARVLGLGSHGRAPQLDRDLSKGRCALRVREVQYMSREEFEQVLGARVDVFPADLYWSDYVRQYIENGGRLTTVSWDPIGLLKDLEGVRCLDAAIPAAGADPNFERLLRLSAFVLAWDSRERERTYTVQASQGGDEPADTPLRKRDPSLSEQDWALFNRYGTDPGFSKDWGNHRDDLCALRELLKADTSKQRQCAIEPEVRELLLRVEKRLTDQVRRADPHFRAYDHPPTAVSEPIAVDDVGGLYLPTLDWRPRLPEDEARFERLVQRCARHPEFEGEPLDQLTGYDPYGRLVIRSPSGSHFVAEWPLVVPGQRYPDEASIVGSAARGGSRAVYVVLPDGSMDLLPADPDDEAVADIPPFSWGYDGIGPHRLASAIQRACWRDYRDPACHDHKNLGFESWLGYQIDQASHDRLDLRIGDVRRWLEGRLDADEDQAWRERWAPRWQRPR
jgi:hypothetical protein